MYLFTLKWFHSPKQFQLFIFSSRTPVKELCTRHLAHLALCFQPAVLHRLLLGELEVIIIQVSHSFVLPRV